MFLQAFDDDQANPCRRPRLLVVICLRKQIYAFAASSNYIEPVTKEPAGHPPSPLTPDEQLAWRALVHAISVITRVLDRDLLQAQGLSLNEYAVLATLSEQPARSMRMSELASEVWVSVSGMTRVVERLARQGLVERAKADTDGRGQLAVLTPAGLTRLKRAYQTHLASVREHVMDHLGDLDLTTFAQAMSSIAAAEIGPPVRRAPTTR